MKTSSACAEPLKCQIRRECRHGRKFRKAGVFAIPVNPVEREQEREPQRAGEVAADAERQVKPADSAQAFCENHEAVLQIALAPAAVALRIFDHRLRRFLVAAFKVVGEPDLPVLAQQQRGFDEIVAQNLSAKRLAPRQLRQIAKLHERLGADDGVVPPVIAEVQRPVIQPGDEHRRVKAVAELLDAAKQGFRVHQRWNGLNQPDRRMRLHQFHQIHERFAAHHAVGVAHHEIAVAPAPGVEKIAHVAALAALVVQPAAVINFAERVQLADQIIPAALLLHPFVRVGGIAQDEKVEAAKLAGFFERFVGGPQPLINARGIFVVNRKDNRRADAVNVPVPVVSQRCDAPARAENPQEKSIHTVHAPMAMNRNSTTNNTSSTTLDADQPVRQSRSANSIETSPVSSTADE